MGRTFERLKVYWGMLWRPSRHLSLGFLTVGGFVTGIIFRGGFNTALEAANTERFCVTCHEMRDNVFAELKTTIHHSNRSGVRAHEIDLVGGDKTCTDCHKGIAHRLPDMSGVEGW